MTLDIPLMTLTQNALRQPRRHDAPITLGLNPPYSMLTQQNPREAEC